MNPSSGGQAFLGPLNLVRASALLLRAVSPSLAAASPIDNPGIVQRKLPFRKGDKRELVPAVLAADNRMPVIYNMHRMHIDDLDFTQIRLIAELARLHSVSAASQK